MHNAMRKLQVWNQLLVICLNSPPRPTWGHSMHFYDQAARTPLIFKSPNKGANRLGLSWGIQNILIFRESGPVKYWRPPPPIPRPPPPPLLTPQNWLIYIPTNSSRHQDSEYVVYISIDTWRQKVMILEASCCGCKIWSLAYALAHMLKLLWREPTICCQIYITEHLLHQGWRTFVCSEVPSTYKKHCNWYTAKTMSGRRDMQINVLFLSRV